MATEDAFAEDLLHRFGESRGRQFFVPSYFEFSDPAALLEFIAKQPLAQLVSCVGEAMLATAAPLIYDGPAPGGGQCFIGHVARRNPHAAAIQRGCPGLALVGGPQAYISARWTRRSRLLPTWNYVAVQLRGRFEGLPGTAATREVVERTIAHMERGAKDPWTLREAEPGLVARLLEHIVAFRFHVESMEGIRRLSQQRSDEDQLRIVAGLQESGGCGEHEIARQMIASLERS